MNPLHLSTSVVAPGHLGAAPLFDELRHARAAFGELHGVPRHVVNEVCVAYCRKVEYGDAVLQQAFEATVDLWRGGGLPAVASATCASADQPLVDSSPVHVDSTPVCVDSTPVCSH